MAWGPQEGTGKAGDILNMQKPAGPLYSWYKKRDSTEAQRPEGAVESPQTAA